jgi:predicted transcriptional regulator
VSELLEIKKKLSQVMRRYVDLCKRRNKLILECAEVIKSHLSASRAPLLSHKCLEELDNVFEELRRARRRLRELHRAYWWGRGEGGESSLHK